MRRSAEKQTILILFEWLVFTETIVRRSTATSLQQQSVRINVVELLE
ncbi:MAG: hypothetical protein HC917_03020 [Richelia sp. SM2_1_7]|nr:hypothetical protein [Richelia sp. SM2_1_7]